MVKPRSPHRTEQVWSVAWTSKLSWWMGSRAGVGMGSILFQDLPERKCGRTKRDAGLSFSTEHEVDGAEKSVCMSVCFSKAFTEYLGRL